MLSCDIGRIARLFSFATLALPLLSAEAVSFNRDIAPLVDKHCVSCHHRGGIGPFALVSYQDVRSHASQIAAVTKQRYMPPWPPQAGYGSFADERRLTEQEIRLLAVWASSGAPEGPPANRPESPSWNDGWQLGQPDLILRMPEPYTMPADGTDVFRNFVLRTNLTGTKYIRATELRLDNGRVVHHANVVLDRARSLRNRTEHDGQPGFAGMDILTEAAPGDFDPDSHFLFWKPGNVLRRDPEAMSWRLDPRTDLVVNLHLQPTGKRERIQAEVGLYFAKSRPTLFPMLVQLENDGAIHIPPGERNFVVTDSLTLPVDTQLLAIYPHAHYLGKVIEAWAQLPDGQRQWLIRIPDWDINWQAVYEYKQPVLLPKGTKVEMRVTYDNSSAHARNPNRPPRWIETGNRSQDEMGHVWLQLLPLAPTGGSRESDLRTIIQEAVMRNRLRKYPGDFTANYNLASLLQLNGKLDEAITQYEAALRADPNSATAHNSLGGAFLAKADSVSAIAQFREALRVDSRYSNARFNLAGALASEGNLDDAASQYLAFLKDEPGDAAAQADLAAVFVRQRRYADAIPFFREAARLKPDDSDTWSNLGTALAITGDFPEAIRAFEKALDINPNAETARKNLARAKAHIGR
jgi:tetratricopeptide (TPR) repeat protein